MSVLHEMFIKIKSSFEGENSFTKASDGFKNVSKEIINLKQSQDKIKNLEVQIKGFEKIQNQINNTKLKNETLTKQIEEFKNSLSNVAGGSNEYKEIEKAIKSLEKEQVKLNVQTQSLETSSKSATDQLKNEGVSTKNLSSEKIKLANKSKDLKGDIDKLTNSQKKNESQTKNNDSTFGKLAGSMKKIAIGMAGAFGLSQMKQYGQEAIALANEKIKAETDLQAMLTNTKSLHGDTTAINKASDMLKDYANQLETVGVIGDETVIAGQAQLATFQLMPSSIKKLTSGMTDMLAKNKGMNATQEDAATLGNLLGKVMNGNVGALSKYGVVMTETQKKAFKLADETGKAAIIAKVLQENYGGANEALGKTDEGKMVIMRAEIEGIKEEFGKGLLPIQRQFFEIFKGQGPNISKILQGALDVAGKFFDIFKTSNPEVFFTGLFNGGALVVDILGKGIDGLTTFITWIQTGSDGVGILGGVVTGLATAFGLYTAAVKISTGWAQLSAWWTGISTTATGALTLEQMALNAVMSLNPIGLIVGALVGLGVGLVYAYKHSETFRMYCDAAWATIKELGTDIMALPSKIKKMWGNGVEKAQIFWDKIKNFWGIINKNPFGKLALDILALASPITAIMRHFDKLKGAWSWVKGKLGMGGESDSKTPKNIPKFAVGGIVNKPTIAEVGEGGDSEAIIPLNSKPRSKALLSYANKIINGDKKQSSIGQTGFENISDIKNSTSPIQVVVNVTVQGIVKSIEEAKQIGQQVGTSVKATLEEQLNQLMKDKGRLSLE